ncbi:MurR/RpiR family transcriptional regulator [Salipiger sp. 1_MG-2023]|uniref:MurR/RpiR family transcriptional regulator n=1 Tax=Salipiger sp. 1_MG-2023 TaxID=3062665 RepID=UPI0026E3A366|nr:MurR/RpiR family transcriptional regulator [Salipiger sp. 1_MG-2023]MDO6588385.1 MurR/RpiR family transcriptional regulator [Salipiger sp. 1_MG-2023]
MKTSEDLASRLRNSAVSAAERKLAAAFAENFPTSALGTVESLATRAGVSGPTVLRYLAKLGFPRFAEFQAAVMQEVDRQLGSPLIQMETPSEDAANEEHLYRRVLLMQAESFRRMADRAVPAEFDKIADLLADPKLSVKTLGGRYSRNLAQRLSLQLGQVRAGVSLIDQPLGFAYDPLLDIGPRDLLVLFDYRRYQGELLRFAEGARDAGARIVLLTDLWRSPIAALAEAVLTAPETSASPFGSRVVPTAQVEALVAAVVERDRDAARKRLARIETLRRYGPHDDEDADD